MRAIQVTQFGGPEVLVPAELDPPVAGPDQLLVEVTAAGVNFADTHRTDGSYRGGGYAEHALAPERRAVDVPDDVTDGQALALLIQGLTAWHVLRKSARLGCGESVLVNAAAGGVGSLAIQLAKHFGAGQVIAAASTPAKRELVLELGADVAVDNNLDGYVDRVRAASGGVDVVLDPTGGPATPAGLACLRDFGRLVNYGNAGREGRPAVDPSALAQRNLSVAGFWLVPAMELPGLYAEARRSHEDLLARRTTGKLVLRP
jgi:NADPH2:quinone reductase